MTIFKIIDTFTFYGLDVGLLAALTCLTVQLLKVTLFKKCKKKIATFLPFIIGGIFYAAYDCAVNLSVCRLLENYVEILERGFTVGALSTVMYIWYEQFIREKKAAGATESVIATLIEGYVPDDEIEAIAKRITQAIEKDVTGDGAKRTAEILFESRPEGITERDVKLLAKLIIETLAHMNAGA